MTGKNLVWLTLDSVRGDRTSVCGSDHATTPTLARIGSRSDGAAGTCFAHGIWSQPSVASILTGTYPSTHGSGSYNETLPESIPTVAERLSESGYRTIGVSSNAYFSEITGTDRGFDRFDFVSGSALAREAGLKGLISFLRNARTFSGGLTLEKRKHSPDFLLGEVVKDRLRSVAGGEGPFFLAAHFSGAHHPYYPSPEFRERFAADLGIPANEAARIAFDHSTDVYARIANGCFDGEGVRETVVAMYDAKVAQADALVGRIISYLDRLGIGEDTIVVVTADHGDLLGELGLCSHKLLVHDALIEVPIAVRGSESLANIEFGLAQHADIMETLLAELGVDTDGMQGIRLDRSSRQLAIAQRGAETYDKTIAEVETYNPDFGNEHILPGFVTAARTTDWKYVTNERTAVLYELPKEDEDVSSEYPEVGNRLEKELDEWFAEYGDLEETTETAEFDEAVENRLADLGYIID